MSTPGKYVRAPSVDPESGTDESACGDEGNGLYARAPRSPVDSDPVDEVDDHQIAPPDHQLELETA